jgi:SEC-C motif-containing protein
MLKIGRNSLCPCGSGLKYKHCCFSKDDQRAREEKERADRRAENVIGGSATIFRHAIDRANDTARKNRRAKK